MEFWNDPVEFARVLGILVPLAVGLVTRSNASSKFKAVTNVALSAIAATAALLVGADGGWDWGGFFNAWFQAFVAGIVAYYGFLKPSGTAATVTNIAPSVGVGGDSATAHRVAA